MIEGSIRELFKTRRISAEHAGGVVLEDILVELHPEVGQGVAGVVGIGDALLAGDALVDVIELNRDVVVSSLLPVFGARCTRCEPLLVGGRQDFFELSKLVVVELSCESRREDGKHGKEGHRDGGRVDEAMHVTELSGVESIGAARP